MSGGVARLGRRPAIQALVRTELRELGPLWILAISAALLLGRPSTLQEVAVAVIALVSVAIGAICFGQEFRHRTMDSLLAQPAARGVIMATKFGVLASLLVTLGAVAFAIKHPQVPDAYVLVPLVCGLCLAPVCTLLVRNELAGMVSAAAVPAVLWIGAQVAALLTYGMSTDRAEQMRTLQSFVFWPGLTGASLLGVAGAAYAFLGLQAFDRLSQDVELPGLRRAPTSAFSSQLRRQSPYWCLLKKELRLQVLPVLVGVLFVLGWFGLSGLNASLEPRVDTDTLRRGLIAIYVFVSVLLITALASAEERRLGVLPAQTLLPMSAVRQFAVKVACVVGVIWLLAVALPLALVLLTPDAGVLPRRWTFNLGFAVIGGPVLAACGLSFGLYVSSVNTGGLRAFLMALISLAIGWCATVVVMGLLWYPIRQVFMAIEGQDWIRQTATLLALSQWVVVGFVAVATVLMLRFAARNHRMLEAPVQNVRRQVGWFVVILVLAASTQQVVQRALWASVVARQRQFGAPSRSVVQPPPPATAVPAPPAPR